MSELDNLEDGDRHPLRADDLVRLERVSAPRLAPDGSRVAFMVQKAAADLGGMHSHIWLLDLSQGHQRKLTDDAADESCPVFSPDGAFVYFISKRSGSAQVWRTTVQGGQSEQVTTLPLDVANLKIAPDGDCLAMSVAVFPDGSSIEDTAQRLKDRESQKNTAQVYDRLFVRHWDRWLDGCRQHLFTLALDSSGSAPGKPVDVTPLDADVPSRPFGGPEEYCFTPDGKFIVFAAHLAHHDTAWSTHSDLYRTPIDGSSEPVNLTPNNRACSTDPIVLPDGRTLAWRAQQRPGYESDRFRIMLLDLESGAQRALSDGWDRSVASLHFAADGETLYATTDHLGQHPLWAIDIGQGKPRLLVERGHVGDIAVGADRIVYCWDDLTAPADLYSLPLAGGPGKRLTEVNAERLAAIDMGAYEQFEFPGWRDETVYGYIVKPADFRAGQKYPVAFIVHGGPQGSMNNHFHYRWNPEVFAGAGYAVVFIDFHGSTGYGQAFTDSINNDWGGKPLLDLQQGLAAAIARYAWLDGERVAALGASYGGFMMNWIAGHWPRRFKCLVNHDGDFDQRMMYYATEELWFPEWDLGGPYYATPASYEKWNPVHAVEHWQTPMLVIQGGRDYRIPETQSLGTFTALQRRGIPSRLVFFPDENHWTQQPANSLKWHEEVLGWLERWV